MSREPRTGPDQVLVVWAAPVRGDALGEWAGLLGDQERRRLSALRVPAARERFVTAHALLRVVVGRAMGWPAGRLVVTATCARCGGPHGRPQVSAPDGTRGPHVSLAHAAQRVVVAVTEAGEVGVDIEAVAHTDFDGFDAVALHEEERRGMRALPAAQRARARATAWVRKEALLKATGDGLMIAPTSVRLTAAHERPRLLRWDDDRPAPATDRLHLCDLDLGADYAACVAVIGDDLPGDNLRGHDLRGHDLPGHDLRGDPLAVRLTDGSGLLDP